jgi:hypothetical protein
MLIKPGSRLHACNLTTQEAEIRRIAVQDQPGQKVQARLHFNQWLDSLVCACHPSQVGSRSRRTVIQAGTSIKPDPFPLRLAGGKTVVLVS